MTGREGELDTSQVPRVERLSLPREPALAEAQGESACAGGLGCHAGALFRAELTLCLDAESLGMPMAGLKSG